MGRTHDSWRCPLDQCLIKKKIIKIKKCKINRSCRERGTEGYKNWSVRRKKQTLLTENIIIATLRAYTSLPQNHLKTQPNKIRTPGRILFEANPEVSTSRWPLSCSNEATAKEDYKYKLRHSLSKGSPVHCCSSNRLLLNFAHESESESNRDNLVFSNFFKINLFRAKIASALKDPFLTAPIIKYGTYCHACLSTKLWFEEFFCFAYLAGSILQENKAHKFAFLIGFSHWKLFFSLTPTLPPLPPWLHCKSKRFWLLKGSKCDWCDWIAK